MKRKAFTLIELLVVIAIIAILAAILFPVFNKARDAAKFTKDQASIKQIGMGEVMYAQDNDDYIAPGYTYDATRTPKVYWGHMAIMLPYYKEKALLRSGFSSWKDNYWINDQNASWTGLYWSTYAPPLSVAWGANSRNLSAPANPSSTILLVQGANHSTGWRTANPDTWGAKEVHNPDWYVTTGCVSHPWDNVYECATWMADTWQKPHPSRDKNVLFAAFDGSARTKPVSFLLGDTTTYQQTEGDPNNYWDMQ